MGNKEMICTPNIFNLCMSRPHNILGIGETKIGNVEYNILNNSSIGSETLITWYLEVFMSLSGHTDLSEINVKDGCAYA